MKFNKLFLILAILFNLELTNFAVFNLKAENLEIVEKKISEDLSINSYILGPGDKIGMEIYDAEEFSGEYRIMKDGKVMLPIIGSVYINNLTIDQAKSKIQNLYSFELIRPELQINVIQPREVTVSIIGEINRPGVYKIENNLMPTIIDAIQASGGITNNTNLKEVIIKRRLPGDNFSFKEAKINLIDLVLKGDQSQNLILFDGDLIKLQKAKKLSENLIEASEANLRQKSISVTIIGEVNKPGTLSLPPDTPLLQAIMIAGGINETTANRRNIKLIRINKNGSLTQKVFNNDTKKGVSVNHNPPMMDGDIVKVSKNISARINSSLGVVVDPLSRIITAVTLFKLVE